MTATSAGAVAVTGLEAVAVAATSHSAEVVVATSAGARPPGGQPPLGSATG
jgi:hypothetical protein